MFGPNLPPFTILPQTEPQASVLPLSVAGAPSKVLRPPSLLIFRFSFEELLGFVDVDSATFPPFGRGPCRREARGRLRRFFRYEKLFWAVFFLILLPLDATRRMITIFTHCRRGFVSSLLSGLAPLPRNISRTLCVCPCPAYLPIW